VILAVCESKVAFICPSVGLGIPGCSTEIGPSRVLQGKLEKKHQQEKDATCASRGNNA
jgi:hypothetical protein